jgi:hypothetical protein
VILHIHVFISSTIHAGYRTYTALAYSHWKKNAGSFDNALPYHTILRKSEKLIGPCSADNASTVAVGKEVQAFTQL